MQINCHRFCLVITALSMFLFSSLPSQLQGRWAQEDEAGVECINYTAHYQVDKSGTYTVESEIWLKVLSEDGRNHLATQTFSYDASRSTLEILEAKTINGDEDYSVPKKNIEDKPLASDPLGLRKDRQILIPFQRVEVGSILCLKSKMCQLKSDIEGHFSALLTFGNYLWKKADITIQSAIPFDFKINDPKGGLLVENNEESGVQVLKISLKKPIFEAFVDETEHLFLDPQTRTQVSISTDKDHDKMGRILGKKYQPILKAALPAALDAIRSQASQISDEKECIDMVVAALIDKITYLGNWNTAEGHTIPRSLDEIITSGQGDCKDYSTTLAAILNSLGYDAKVALVLRDRVYIEDNTLPSPLQFNHAIVKVVSSTGKTYWIDPTNITTMAGLIYPDIADRPALILDAENPSYEKIPSIDYRQAQLLNEGRITRGKGDTITMQGSLYLQGESAKTLTELFCSHPHSVVKDAILKRLSDGKDPINPSLTLANEISRKVQDLKADYSYEVAHAMLRTNLGEAIPLKTDWYEPYVMTSQNHEGALFIGHPETRIRKTVFQMGSIPSGLEKLEFSIESPWVNAKREFDVSKDTGEITLTETAEILKGFISAKDLKSSEFNKLSNILRQYCDGVAIVF